jgi:Sulfatase-modifying factor enzyme 1
VWTKGQYPAARPPVLRGTAESRRVVRGGAFNNNRQNVRCAYRNNNHPDNRNNNIGFRVVSHGFRAVCPEKGGLLPVHRGGQGFRGKDRRPVQPFPGRARIGCPYGPVAGRAYIEPACAPPGPALAAGPAQAKVLLYDHTDMLSSGDLPPKA